MEIYKLDLTNKHKRDNMEGEALESGRVSDGDSGEVFGGNSGGADCLMITDLRQGVRNQDRVNVYVNSKYAFSLAISQVVELKIKVGREISEEELEEFRRASEFGKLYQRTLEWVLIRPRSEKETRDYLYKKIYEKKLDKKYIDQIVEKLKDKKYLDDYKFAEYYVENRFVKKGISSRRLKMELMKKGVSQEIVEAVSTKIGRNDRDEIKKVIAKKQNKYDDEKLIQYLCRQGFPYDLVLELVRSSGRD